MLKRLFLPQRYQQTHHNVITPTLTSNGRREWVMGRSLCHYRLFDLQEVPSHRWDAVLTHKIRQWSPFNQYQQYIAWQGAHVQVWVWEQARHQQALVDNAIKQIHSLPETVLYPRPKMDGIRLLSCLEGVEGQIWQAGLLVGSRWWETSPTLLDWQRFQRAHGLALSDHVPAVETFPFLDKTWAKTHQLFSGALLRQERLWFLLGSALLLTLAMWQGISIWKWQQATISIQTDIDALMGQSAPILDARTATLADKQRLERLLSLNSQPTQLLLLTQVAEKLPQKVKLVDWFYQTGTLKFAIEATSIDPRFYVETFQNIPLFREVQTESGRTANQLIISMRVEAEKPNLAQADKTQGQ
ncbi:hypothetical protein [Beggiatoa leptomitoformis]|uniref:Uncharacterized protein n=1 Tax=Beggiatoa leptomitoformis TaxID=288004 RepID=A0A2N9YI03_9GAMM|nr:hypothetical protein [Beggiatoa leptomitoformis]ALG67671.1 hypothetical protein AL038_08070 [Beggiatoa leptomitoformis]AUI70093.1 hypothetical protein BLE401_16235 [Beggiatoa leptomitoformis]